MSQELISRITQSLGRQEQQLSFAITLMEHLVVPGQSHECHCRELLK